ncbi:PREDICTED: olfactory receptor 14A16-like [Gekko japonicus]|uniref:Olfactory receptor n=1 Tax=Gekko japonicus TaxID=146911 RepID=A0ABM1JHU7_GEKJA|nr:PREDICTED: olfactory receptor 14A16-like [Gekko japonicus]
MVNQTIVTEFVLLGFASLRELQILHAVFFLAIYLVALMGNFLLIAAVAHNLHFHSPMYFFLVNLSIVDVCYISTTVPKSIVNSLMGSKQISFPGCVAQVFLVILLASSELFLLTAMAYDRYAAICHPLRYQLIMNWNVCFQMAAASWVISVTIAVVDTVNTFSLQLCQSNVIDQYFCDMPQLLKISCTDTATVQSLIFASSFSLCPFCFTVISVSYVYIFSAVFKIQSAQGRQKAFSTCTPHLTVFCLFFFTVSFSYMRPKALSSPTVDLLAAVLYTVLPPVMNPIIYSLRNKDMQLALRRAMTNFPCFSWVGFEEIDRKR